MRDKRFVAVHRGGLLTMKQHKQLVAWACSCSEHVLHLLTRKSKERLTNALKIAKDWTADNATVGDARNASHDAIAVARTLIDPVEIAIARSIGHAVATPHMADHSLRAAAYALKAIEHAGQSTAAERQFQQQQLSPDIAALML